VHANKVDERPCPGETATGLMEKLPHSGSVMVWPCPSVSVCLVALDSWLVTFVFGLRLRDIATARFGGGGGETNIARIITIRRTI
jgi:hypothetical protein